MLVSHGVYHVKEGITDTLLNSIRSDKNCARSLMGNSFDLVVTPETQWHTLMWGTIPVGAVMRDAPLDNGFQCCHIHLLEEYKDKERAAILTQLSAIASLVRGVRPFTICAATPKYEYMRYFLSGCGFVMAEDTTHLPFNTFVIPKDWVPTFQRASILF